MITNLNLYEWKELDRIIQRGIDSFDGCGCDCSPASKDEDGNPITAHTCLICDLKEAKRLLNANPNDTASYGP